MIKEFAISSSMLIIAILCGTVSAEKPQISQIYPDFPDVNAPKLIVGENFGDNTEIWQYSPQQERENAGESLPNTPPEGSQRCNIRDRENQVIIADVSGDIVWAKNADGFSDPYLINVAKPYWISDEKVKQGDVAHIYGFGLRANYRDNKVMLKNDKNTVQVAQIVEARSPRTPDHYLVYFEIPNNAPKGIYEVLVHNGYGGKFGWAKAGNVEIIERGEKHEIIINVRDYGAKGDGVTNDYWAINSAIDRAEGRILFFPQGVYMTDRTINIPSGIKVRGADRNTSIIQGYGEAKEIDRVAWFTLPNTPPSAVIRLHDNTMMESITIQGATFQGSGGQAPVEAVPNEIAIPDGGEVRNVTIQNCNIIGREEEFGTRRNLYRAAIFVGPNSRHINILDNEIYGSIIFNYGVTTRTEIIGNKIHGGAASDVVALNANGIDCLIDGNLLVDTPARIVFQPIRHCHLRYNEVHQAFRGTWANAEEIYLLHGGAEKTFGLATSADSMTLKDEKQNWAKGSFKDATVLITAGKGFGQYRIVTDNNNDIVILDKAWRIIPDETSEYVVGKFMIESSFFANLNDTNCRMSLWLDCISCIVDMHRDSFAGGADLWGSDDTGMTEDGKPKDVGRIYPSYYNLFHDCWFDGSLVHLWSGAKSDNLLAGPPMFGNYVVGNKIRQPHTKRTGFEWFAPHGEGGIIVGNRSNDMTKPQDKRVALSHTVVANNFVSFTNAGIAISDYARKTLLSGNEFQKVDYPILDWGAMTRNQGNSLYILDEKGSRKEQIESPKNEREIKPKTTILPEKTDNSISPISPTIWDMHVLVSQPAYCFYENVNDKDAELQCQNNLKRLYDMIREYEVKKGNLPNATFFPEKPFEDADSLAFILGKEANQYFVCPSSSPDFRSLGYNYVWNERLSGKKSSEIADPANAWLMMDFVGVHKWMVEVKSCGHLGKVNILYSDGTVKSGIPMSLDEWADWTKKQ